VRAASLITTVFGDTIAPRGGVVWLGSLIQVLNEFGISERLVRTSVFRLVRDGWLTSRQLGRRSFYSLTVDGRARFDAATQRIYSLPSAPWDGEWTLLILSGLSVEQKEAARRELNWLGFGALSANLMAHPATDAAEVRSVAARLDIQDVLLVMSAKSIESERAIQASVQTAWNLTDIDAGYRDFIALFRTVARALDSDKPVSPQQAFFLRTVLIQEYRKVLLRDPQLPEALLPPDWQGPHAYRLCSALYRRVYRAADEYVSEVLETESGQLPVNSAAFYRRFGGLKTA
jgi:phenylacetic acid degradation operon negative regulatory protein